MFSKISNAMLGEKNLIFHYDNMRNNTKVNTRAEW